MKSRKFLMKNLKAGGKKILKIRSQAYIKDRVFIFRVFFKNCNTFTFKLQRENRTKRVSMVGYTEKKWLFYL